MNQRPDPNTWIRPWPHGTPVPGTPRAVVWLAKLATHIAEHEPADLATATGLHPATIEAVRDGRTWPTLHTTLTLLDAVNDGGRRGEVIPPRSPHLPRRLGQ